MERHKPISPRWVGPWVPLYLFLLTGFSFMNVLGGPFQFDDLSAIEKNPYIRNLKNIPSFFVSRKTYSVDGEKKIYRPLRTTLHSLEYSLWGTDPLGYHLVNILFHFGAALFLFQIALVVSKDRLMSFASASLFSLMPVHAESVSYISGGDDAIAGFFFLTSLYVYLRRGMDPERLSPLGWLVPALFAVALLAKEMAITFPLVVFLADRYFFKERVDFRSGLRSVYLPLLAVALVYFVMRTLVVGSVSQTGADIFGGPYALFCSIMVGIAYYVKLMLLPVNLCADYMLFPKYLSLVHPAVAVSCLIISFFLFLCVRLAKSIPVAAFGLAFFFATLLPVAHIFPIKILIAERFLYIPSAGFCLFAGALLCGMIKEIEEVSSVKLLIARSLVVLLLTMNGLLLAERNSVWLSDLALWADVVVKYPRNARAHSNLGTAYYARGKKARAIIEFRRGMKMYFPQGTDRHNLGVIYAEMGLYEKALSQFKMELKSTTSPYVRKSTLEKIKRVRELMGKD